VQNGTRYRITATRRIAAPAARVYDILADYRAGHPRILPRAFGALEVEQGGKGAGTVIRFDVKAFGRTQTVRQTVDEPEPGRVLVERDVNGPNVTTFIVERGATDNDATVTIQTEMTSRPGWLGAVERVTTRMFLRRLYKEELNNLDAIARASV